MFEMMRVDGKWEAHRSLPIYIFRTRHCSDTWNCHSIYSSCNSFVSLYLPFTFNALFIYCPWNYSIWLDGQIVQGKKFNYFKYVGTRKLYKSMRRKKSERILVPVKLTRIAIRMPHTYGTNTMNSETTIGTKFQHDYEFYFVPLRKKNQWQKNVKQ